MENNIKQSFNYPNKYPTVIYQFTREEFPQLVDYIANHAVTQFLEQYQQTATPTPTISGGGLMSVAEVCECLHVTKQTLNNWDKMNYLSKVKVGRRVLYRREDVEALARTNKR